MTASGGANYASSNGEPGCLQSFRDEFKPLHNP